MKTVLVAVDRHIRYRRNGGGSAELKALKIVVQIVWTVTVVGGAVAIGVISGW